MRLTVCVGSVSPGSDPGVHDAVAQALVVGLLARGFDVQRQASKITDAIGVAREGRQPICWRLGVSPPFGQWGGMVGWSPSHRPAVRPTFRIAPINRGSWLIYAGPVGAPLLDLLADWPLIWAAMRLPLFILGDVRTWLRTARRGEASALAESIQPLLNQPAIVPLDCTNHVQVLEVLGRAAALLTVDGETSGWCAATVNAASDAGIPVVFAPSTGPSSRVDVNLHGRAWVANLTTAEQAQGRAPAGNVEEMVEQWLCILRGECQSINIPMEVGAPPGIQWTPPLLVP